MNPTLISSKNPIYKKLASLLKSKGVKEHGLALVSGEKITQEVARLNPLPKHWVIAEGMTEPNQRLPEKTVTLSPNLFDELDVIGSHKPLLVVTTPQVQAQDQLAPNKATLFVAMGDPNNLGSLIRTCAAFNWPQIVLLQEAANPFLPRTLKASSGTSLSAPLFTGPSIHDLKSPTLVAMDLNGTPLNKFTIPHNVQIVIGEEGQGVPAGFSGTRVSLPISNKVESLNATIAAGLFVYEWSRNQP